ncbi:MAG TPA: ATP-binding cassette domain-containing protein [Candidatus Kapabacteria bacterium]|nr:ATP-binding cassette domain-containing protein [Candidatus Kapabacteria bacterium]
MTSSAPNGEAFAITTHNLRKEFRRIVRSPGLRGLVESIGGRTRATVTTAVQSLSLQVRAGERIAFIGPNGSGKSTTIKMLTGILHPTSGDASVLGFNPWRQRKELAYHLGSVFGQKSQLWFHLPPMETFFLLARIFELEEQTWRSRLDLLVDAFGIRPYLHTPVRKLSLGERMRCEVVASLLHRPSLLLLDEPTIGLDVVAKATLREHIRDANLRDGTTIFITSHDAGDVEMLAERVIVIAEGEAMFDGPVAELRRRYLRTKRLEARFAEPLTEAAMTTLRNHPDAPWKMVAFTEFSVTLDLDTSRPEAARDAMAWLGDQHAIEDITIAEPPLEEVIRIIYEEEST